MRDGVEAAVAHDEPHRHRARARARGATSSPDAPPEPPIPTDAVHARPPSTNASAPTAATRRVPVSLTTPTSAPGAAPASAVAAGEQARRRSAPTCHTGKPDDGLVARARPGGRCQPSAPTAARRGGSTPRGRSRGSAAGVFTLQVAEPHVVGHPPHALVRAQVGEQAVRRRVARSASSRPVPPACSVGLLVGEQEHVGVDDLGLVETERRGSAAAPRARRWGWSA